MKTKKHIVILHPHFTLPGGAGKFALEVGQRLTQRGYKVTVISMQSKRELTESAPNIRFIDVRGPVTSSFLFWLLYPYWYLRVRKMIDVLQPDVLFPQVFPAQWWAFLYKRSNPSMRIVWMCQEPSAFIHSATWIKAIHSPVKRYIAGAIKGLFARIDISLAKLADVLVANSSYSRDQIAQVYGIEARSIPVAHPGVSDKFLQRKYQAKRKPIVVTVSRISAFKNIDFLIQSFIQFASVQSEPWQFVIVGEGEEKETLKMLVSSLKAQDSISFAGQLADGDLCELLASSTLYLSASVDEPFGISIVEAQALGAIPVVHQSGGPASTVIHGKTGSLVSELSVKAYAKAMQECLDLQQTKKLTQAAFKHGRTFNWSRTTDVIEQSLFPSNK